MCPMKTVLFTVAVTYPENKVFFASKLENLFILEEDKS